jgi:hypothetical protein
MRIAKITYAILKFGVIGLATFVIPKCLTIFWYKQLEKNDKGKPKRI